MFQHIAHIFVNYFCYVGVCPLFPYIGHYGKCGLMGNAINEQHLLFNNLVEIVLSNLACYMSPTYLDSIGYAPLPHWLWPSNSNICQNFEGQDSLLYNICTLTSLIMDM